jgi:ABC-type transport system involved in multi-copper enzyme maturation permease subunit
MTAASAPIGTGRRSRFAEFGGSVGTIMVKELRSRMRGRRAFVVLTVYLGLLALITYGVYIIVSPAARDGFGFGGGTANASALIGQSIFTVLSIFQLILVSFIAPAFTSGQISLEREKQTLDLLISTPMRPGAIVIGKLLAALAFVALMIVAAIPITAIVLMYGGASVDDVVRQQVVLLATALVLGAIGLFFSALLKRTQAATVLTYITLLGLTLGTLMLFVFWSIFLAQNEEGFGPPDRAPEHLMWVNPGVAMLDVVSNTEPGGFGAFSQALAQIRGEGVDFGGGMDCRGNICVPVDQFGNPVEEGQTISGYWWPRVTLTLVAISVVLTLLSMRLVIPPGMRWAFRRSRRTRGASRPGAMSADDGGNPSVDEVSPDAAPHADGGVDAGADAKDDGR